MGGTTAWNNNAPLYEVRIMTDVRSEIADVLMTPNQAWRGMKTVPIELIWGLEQLIDRVRIESEMFGRIDELENYTYCGAEQYEILERIKELKAEHENT